MVSVAQLVEPRIVIPVVVGSSPIVHPSFSAGTHGQPLPDSANRMYFAGNLRL